MALDNINLKEIHFFGLPSQSNVYGLTKLTTSAGVTKLLAATLERQTYSLAYLCEKSHGGNLIPVSKEVHFTYIPGDAEIISIDAFNKSKQSNDFVVGITFIKAADNQSNNQYFFNIYFDWEPGSDFNLDAIAQSCTSVDLSFIPYKLYHTELKNNKNQEIVWLLSGSDNQVHLYLEEKHQHKYIEKPIQDHFPELNNFASIVLTIDIVYFDGHKKRLTAVGCEDGNIYLSLVDVVKKEISRNWSINHDGPITSVHIFTMTYHICCPSYLQPIGETGSKEDSMDNAPEFHLLVTTALEPAAVYRNVLHDGLSDQKLLPNSQNFDCTLCACIADLDMDGKNEIVLGTFGQELLVYKYEERYCNDDSPPPDYPQSKGEFNLQWQRTFSNPIHAVDYLDITGDGVRELVVLSSKGLHVMQHDLDEVAALCEQRLMKILQSVQKNDTHRELHLDDL